MSRQEREYVIGKGQRQLPIKWTAPEALMSGRHYLVTYRRSGFVFSGCFEKVLICGVATVTAA